MDQAESIRTAYIDYLLNNGHRPASVFLFAKKLKLTEAAFYEYFNSFEQLESAIWLRFFEQARSTAEAEALYAQYSVREKLLSFYYTWIEVLKANRSFVLMTQAQVRRTGLRQVRRIGEAFRRRFENYVTDLLLEGRESKEVAQRPFVIDRYPALFFGQALFVLNFWIHDTSKGFEKTDSAIEKAVNTSFDLIGTSALDSVLDFAKFIYQNRP